MVHIQNGIQCNKKKEKGIPTLFNSIDKTVDYYAKLKQPVGERQIPYDLTYKRNLMHKRN